jgi:hypothetical protein
MIGDMWNNNKRRDVCTREGQLMYRGKKYAREESTGYYVCTTGSRRRLHTVIWEDKWGVEIPPGCVIHHLDWDKTHNDVENLICVTVWEHEKIHNIIGGEAGKRFGYELINSRVNGLPASK